MTCLRIKTVLYLSIIASGWLLGLVFPFAQLFGVGPSTLFMAIFKPYFGWRKTLAISFFISTVAVAFALPYFMGVSQGQRTGFAGWLDWGKTQLSPQAENYNEALNLLQDAKSLISALPLELIYVVGFYFMRFAFLVGSIWALKKTPLWRIIQL